MKSIIGVDVGGTKCAVSLGSIDDTGEIQVIDKIIYQTKCYPSPYQMIEKLQDAVEVFLLDDRQGDNCVQSIGISCGGPLDSKKGIILSPPNLPGWDTVNIVSSFQKKFGVPTAIQNDANACALAEWKFGAGKGCQNVIFLTFGTGLGAGLILDGKLYSGTNDMAGEVGHIRLEKIGPVGYGKTGSFEGFCSGNGIAQLAQIKAKEKFQMGSEVAFCKGLDDIDSITAQTVAEAAFKGDALAKEIYEICGTYLGKGLSVLIDILNPERIIIGSIFVKAGELLLSALNKQIETESLPHASRVCKVVPAMLDETIGDFAALSVAAYNLENPKE